MIVRPGQESDVTAVLLLIRTLPELPQWTRAALAIGGGAAGDRTAAVRRLLVADDAGTVVGFAQSLLVVGEAELESIVVHPAWQRRGVGRLLLHRIMELGAQDGATLWRLEVRAGNQAALQMYRACGFRATGSRRGYYTHPVEDAVLLERPVAD